MKENQNNGKKTRPAYRSKCWMTSPIPITRKRRGKSGRADSTTWGIKKAEKAVRDSGAGEKGQKRAREPPLAHISYRASAMSWVKGDWTFAGEDKLHDNTAARGGKDRWVAENKTKSKPRVPRNRGEGGGKGIKP